jgi:cysteine desulfurase/selenocysteine lyase
MGMLQEIGADIYGPELGAPRAGLVSFNLPGVHAHDVAEICARNQVCVKAGHHCAQPLHNEILGVAASVRASFAIHSTSKDADNLLAALRNAQQIFA